MMVEINRLNQVLVARMKEGEEYQAMLQKTTAELN